MCCDLPIIQDRRVSDNTQIYWHQIMFKPLPADVLRKMFPLLAFRGCYTNVQSCRVRFCKIINTSIYYVFITTRSYVVTPTPVDPSCSPLDGDESHDRPLLHVSPGNQHVAQLLYRFWNRNPARIVPPWSLTGERWNCSTRHCMTRHWRTGQWRIDFACYELSNVGLSAT